MRGRTSAARAWTLWLVTAAVAGGLTLLVLHTGRRPDDDIAIRAAAAKRHADRASPEREMQRIGELFDQMAAMDKQLTQLERAGRQRRRPRADSVGLTPRNAEGTAKPPTADEAPLPLAPELSAGSAVEPEAQPESVIQPLRRAWAEDVSRFSPAAPSEDSSPVPGLRRKADAPFMRTQYVTFGLLQAVDTGSTIASLRSGALEANPLMRGVAANPAGLIAVKAAATVGTIYAIEKLRERKPLAAAITMVALNTLYTTVAIHNARTMATPRRTRQDHIR